MKNNDVNELIIKFNELSLFREENLIINQPNLIGVGAGRCGTTSLYEYLSDHPDVYMSPVKEINYFGIRNIDSNGYGLTFNEYLHYFSGAQQEKYIGEISPAYLTLPESISMIKEKLDQPKILITIRDPIERALSQYKHQFEYHCMKDINEYFQIGLKSFNNKTESQYIKDWFNPAKNIMQSLYYTGIKSCLDFFGKESIIIFKYDDIKEKPSMILEQLCNFLSLDYDQKELGHYNSSFLSQKLFSKSKNELKLSHKVIEKLLYIFDSDLKKLDALTGFSTVNWLNNY